MSFISSFQCQQEFHHEKGVVGTLRPDDSSVSGKGVYILPRIPLTEGVGRLGP